MTRKQPSGAPRDGEVFCSIVGAMTGEFELLVKRLRSGAQLDDVERQFLAKLLDGRDWSFIVKPRDGRRRSDRAAEKKRRAMADFVHAGIRSGLSRMRAYEAADDVFRDGKTPRPASARAAYREFYPEQFGTTQQPDE
jgi:hypothetical protein